jgi:hypothetical protein
VCVWVLAVPCCAQIPDVEVLLSGSAPSSTCIALLRQQPYEEASTQRCLKAILASKHFNSGHVTTERHEDGNTHISFELHSPGLILSEVLFDMSEQDRSDVEKLMRANPDVLRPDGEYSRKAEVATIGEISEYFFRRGRRVGVLD